MQVLLGKYCTNVYHLLIYILCSSGFPTGQSTCGAASGGATVAGSFLGGVVFGGVVALLVVGILCGCWKLKHSGGGKSCQVNSEDE